MLSTKEMAAHLGVAGSTLLLWYYRGMIPGEKVARKGIAFDWAKVEQALKEHVRNNPNETNSAVPKVLARLAAAGMTTGVPVPS